MMSVHDLDLMGPLNDLSCFLGEVSTLESSAQHKAIMCEWCLFVFCYDDYQIWLITL